MLQTLLGQIFPFKKFIPGLSGQDDNPVNPQPPAVPTTPGDFYPGMSADRRLGPGGEMPGSPMDERLPSGESVYQATNRAANNSFFPVSTTQPSPATAQPVIPPPTVQSDPMSGQPMDVADAYKQAGGVDYSTPDFYPTAKGVKPSTARQAAFETAYEAMTPEQKQDALLQGKAPVDHNAAVRFLKGAVRGFAKGGLGGAAVGATTEGFFPGMNRKMNAESELPDVTKQVEVDRQRAADARAQAREDAYTKNIDIDNQRQRDALTQKTDMDNARVRYWNRKADQGDLKLASNDELLQLRDKWMTSKNDNDKKRLDLADKELTERSRHNQATEKQQATNEAGRNTRANFTQNQQNQRQQISIAAQKEAAALRAAQAAGRQQEAQTHQENLLKLKQQYEGIVPLENSTP